MSPNRHADYRPFRYIMKQSYYMPNFQRGYVWGEAEVGQLLTDLEEALNPENDNDLMLGQLMTFEDDERRFNIIDGQQRMTTLFMLMLAARDIARPNESVFKAITSLIHTAGHCAERTEEELHLQHSKDYIQSLWSWIYNTPGVTPKNVRKQAMDIYREVNSDLFGTDTKRRVSLKKTEIGAIVEAFGQCYEWLIQTIGTNPDAYQDLLTLLFHDISFLVTLTRDDVDAQQQFERANSRGRPLNAFNLLKNTVIQNTPRDKHRPVEEIWDQMQTLMERSQTQPNQMMRAAYIAGLPNSVHRDGTFTVAQNWFRGREQLAEIQKNTILFSENLKHLWVLNERMHLLQDPGGAPCHPVAVMQGLSNKLDFLRPVYFAAHKLPSDLFLRVMTAVETATAAAYLTKFLSRNLQPVLISWVPCIAKIQNSDDVDFFVANHVAPFIRQKRAQARRDLETMSEPSQNHNTLTILKKASAHFEKRFGYGDRTEQTRFSDYDGFTIEHIRPRAGKKKKDGDLSPVFKLGNLCLLEKSLNSSIQDKHFDEKREAYDLSTCRLTKQLVRSQSFGTNTLFATAAKGAPVFDQWDDEDIKKRQSFMADLLMEAWKFDAPETL